MTNGITPWCSFGVYSHLDTVNLYHNYPPPARLTVSIIGPSTVRPNVPCVFTAVHTGGTPPLTYGWRPSGTQEDSSVIEQFASDSYLYLTVVDSLNQWAYNSMLVRVTPSAPVCPYAPVR